MKANSDPTSYQINILHNISDRSNSSSDRLRPLGPVLIAPDSTFDNLFCPTAAQDHEDTFLNN